MRRTALPALALLIAGVPSLGAEVGICTVLDGPGRLLRGPSLFRLAEGARIQEGDIVEVPGRSQAQLELVDGGTLNLFGPGALYVASVPLREGKLSGAAEFSLTGGWLKVAARALKGGLRVRTAIDVIATAEAVAVLYAEASADSGLVETGTVQVIELGRAGAQGPGRSVKGGEFWSRAVGKPFATAARPSEGFLAALPRHFIDPLPSRLPKFQATHVEVIFDHDITYAEAKPWLSGPYRKTFLARLKPRLHDPGFRSGVEADIRSYPEWDRILHPEKYLPKTGTEKR